jgi:hypothetical protein
MSKGLSIILEQPTPKEGAKPLFPDGLGGLLSRDGEGEKNASKDLLGNLLGNTQTKFDIDYEVFSKTTDDPKLSSLLDDAKKDANSNQESSRVSNWLGVYNDPVNGMRIALAGRLKGGKENFYYEVVKKGSEWGWIDVEENNKWKPFEEY